MVTLGQACGAMYVQLICSVFCAAISDQLPADATTRAGQNRQVGGFRLVGKATLLDTVPGEDGCSNPRTVFHMQDGRMMLDLRQVVRVCWPQRVCAHLRNLLQDHFGIQDLSECIAGLLSACVGQNGVGQTDSSCASEELLHRQCLRAVLSKVPWVGGLRCRLNLLQLEHDAG